MMEQQQREGDYSELAQKQDQERLVNGATTRQDGDVRGSSSGASDEDDTIKPDPSQQGK